MESVIEDMKKSLLEFKSWKRIPLDSSGLKEELPSRQLPPTTQCTMEGNDLHASVQHQKRKTCSVVPRTYWETCVGELEPRRDCSGAPRSSAPWGQSKLFKHFESHSCATFACTKMQTTDGQARGSTRVSLSQRMSKMSGCVAPVVGAWPLQVCVRH